MAEYKTSKDSWDGTVNGGSKVWATTDHLLSITFKTTESSFSSSLKSLELGVVKTQGEVGKPPSGQNDPYEATWKASDGSNIYVLAYDMFSNSRERDYHHAANGQAILGSATTFTLIERRGIDSDSDGNVNYHAYTSTAYTITKSLPNDASIDSRLFFGDANEAVEYDANPNTVARNVKFGLWTYKGGLFVGNMPWASRDQSGVSRLQLFGGSSPATHRFAVLSLFYLEKSENSSGSLDIGAFFPASNDSNLSVTETDSNWSNRWNIVPQSSEPNPADYSKYPVSRFSIGSTASTLEYVNWPLTKDTQTFDMATQKVCLAIHDEGNQLNSTVWRYFASREYQNLYSAFPQNDSRPRIWLLIEPTSNTEWTVQVAGH